MRSYKAWTPEEDAVLASMRSAGSTFARIAERLGRTEGATADRFKRLKHGGVVSGVNRSPQPWTLEEDRLLCEAYGAKVPLAETARRLGRSESAVKGRIGTLGIGLSHAARKAAYGTEPGRRCHDCGKPTPDYRCLACRHKWQVKNHVVRDSSAEGGE